MGCDIHTHAERRVNGKWEKLYNSFTAPPFEAEYYGKSVVDSPFIWRSYFMFGLLAGVRSKINSIAEPKGFPDDASAEVKADYEGWGIDAHTPSFLTAKELLNFNYDAIVFRSPKESYRDNLSELFFTHLKELSELGDPDDVRVVFWFGN